MSEAAHSQNATFSLKFFASKLFSCSQGLFLVAATEVSVAKWYSVGLLTEVGGSIPSRNTFFHGREPIHLFALHPGTLSDPNNCSYSLDHEFIKKVYCRAFQTVFHRFDFVFFL